MKRYKVVYKSLYSYKTNLYSIYYKKESNFEIYIVSKGSNKYPNCYLTKVSFRINMITISQYLKRFQIELIIAIIMEI